MEQSTFRVPTSPLLPLSPERINTRTVFNDSNGQSFQPSPSLPDLTRPKQLQSNSDVQAMVSRFNSLEINDHVEVHKRDAAALKRAQMGREEAETELKRCREEVRQLKKDVDEGSSRERRVMKRLDVVMEELHRQKETQVSAQTLYEREIRRARKEAFKSSSLLVKVQEDLKSTRATLSVTRTDLETERARARQRDQDVFAARYELVAVQEDLGKEQEKCTVLMTERDALKCQLKEEEVARIASEGMIALPSSTPQRGDVKEDDEFASPNKWRTAAHTPRVQSVDLSRHRLELETLRDELVRVSIARDAAEGHVEFMKMECQFQCCSCRIAEHKGIAFVHDTAFTAQSRQLRPISAVVNAEDPPAYDEMVVDGPPAAPSESIDTKQLSHPPTPRPAFPFEHEEIEQQPQPKLRQEVGNQADNVFHMVKSGRLRNDTIARDEDLHSQEQRPVLRSIDSNLVTTSRPTVYINANGHPHEEEHQLKKHNRRSTRDSYNSQDPNIFTAHTTESTTPMKSSTDKPEAHLINPTTIHTPLDTPKLPFSSHKTATVGEHNSPENIRSDTEEDQEDLLDEYQESPTTHIQATTKITTIPLAPLSSPIKQAHPPTPRHADARSVSRSPSRATSQYTTPEPESPSRNQNANGMQRAQNEGEVPRTPGFVEGAAQSAEVEANAEPENPWTPFTTSTLTREEAIERIRARRGRDRERATTATTTNGSTGGVGATSTTSGNTGPTLKRAASHGDGLVNGRTRERREGWRDVSAPENCGRDGIW